MIVVLKWRSRTLARSGILSNSSCLVAKGLATVPEQAGATSPSNAQNRGRGASREPQAPLRETRVRVPQEDGSPKFGLLSEQH